MTEAMVQWVLVGLPAVVAVGYGIGARRDMRRIRQSEKAAASWRRYTEEQT